MGGHREAGGRPGETPLEELAAAIGFPPGDLPVLATALTHRSAANEEGGESYERLEFLGDAVLGLVVGEFLYRRYPEAAEGRLAKMRALIVSEPTLARRAGALNLGRYLRLGRGEAMTGGRERKSNLADAFEAVVGAFYHAGGLEAAKSFILAQLGEELDRTNIGRPWDAKTRLQELLQAGGVKPTYVVTGEEGPDHDKWFTVACLAGGRNLGVGRGRSKKEAEQAAARQALAVLEGGGGREAPR